jgi:uncharacterized repeat protein (TIGR03803 family)
MVLFVSMQTVASAQTFDTLVNFDLTNGSYPFASPVQGTDGNYYGATSQGGNTSCGYPGCGTIFKITAAGTLTTLYSFCAQWPCPDGYAPQNVLAEATNGDFYGTTWQGGASNAGTVFKITPTGTLTTLYSFCPNNSTCPDGKEPAGTLVLAANGNFYGVTAGGGTESGPDGTGGTFFEITPSGKLTTLYSFCSQANCADGGEPATGPIQGADGNFYGTTYVGGNTGVFGQNDGCVVPGIGPFYLGCGTIYKITPQGKLTILHTFCLQANCPDGAFPGYGGGLVQAANGNFYGTTNQGGAEVACAVSGYGNESCGTVFEITPKGTLTTLHSFCSENPPTCDDGFFPYGMLTQGSDGNLYGTTEGNHGGNGENNLYTYGTVFEITPTGTLTTLHVFCNQDPPYCNDGSGPLGPPAQGTNGNFYGTASAGGTSNNYGTVYSLSTGLGPFVTTIPTAGNEGTQVSILGQGFAGSSVVKFGGTQTAAVTLNGAYNLIATVPAGALTGPVTVTTSGNTLQSSQKYLVLPKVVGFSPMSGPVGTPVTITGTGFLQGLGAGFGDSVPGTHFKIVSDTTVMVDVPSGAKTGPVGVETKGGIGISKQTFTVTP